MFIVLAAHVRLSPHYARFRPALIPKHIDWAVCREIFTLGIPIAGAQMLAGAMFTVAAITVGVLGADILAAQMIVYSVIYTCLSSAVAFGDAVRVRVAYGIGRGSAAASRQSARLAIVMAAIFILIATLVLWLLPEQLFCPHRRGRRRILCWP